MKVMNEVREGFQSTIYLRCEMCNTEKTLNLCNASAEKEMDINMAFTVGAISTGLGHSTLPELFSAANMPSISSALYQKCHENLADVINKEAWNSMEEAGKEEYDLAVKAGDVGTDNIPYITVINDGAWAKRSYNVNYDSSSGVVRIFSIYLILNIFFFFIF